jgi:hypothetical protein
LGISSSNPAGMQVGADRDGAFLVGGVDEAGRHFAGEEHRRGFPGESLRGRSCGVVSHAGMMREVADLTGLTRVTPRWPTRIEARGAMRRVRCSPILPPRWLALTVDGDAGNFFRYPAARHALRPMLPPCPPMASTQRRPLRRRPPGRRQHGRGDHEMPQHPGRSEAPGQASRCAYDRGTHSVDDVCLGHV